MRGYQTIPQQIESVALSGLAASTVMTKLNKLQVSAGRQHLHLIGFVLEVDVTGLTTSSGTVTPDELNLLLGTVKFHDGNQVRAQIGGRDLATFERYESGYKRVGDPITTASTSTMQLRRYFSVGPPRMAGSPGDFAIPCAMLDKGYIQVDFAAATTVEANITVFTANYKISAVCVAMDEIRIPPFLERKVVPVAADDQIVGERKVLFSALGNSAAWDAITVGDFGVITLRNGGGIDLVPSVDAALLTHAYNWDMAAGQLGGVVGDARSAGDLATREINPGTPTALQASAAVIQPVTWMQPGGRLSKVTGRIRNSMQIKTSGAGATNVLALTSVLPQSPQLVAQFADEIRHKLGDPRLVLNIKLQKKGRFNENDARYMPYSLKSA